MTTEPQTISTGPQAGPVHVVIAPTPDQHLPAPQRVQAQRRAAREALARAAALAGCPERTFEKSSPRGRPVPTASGWHWTISHDRWLVAAAVHPTSPIGVDLERIALRRRLLVERVTTLEERRLFGEPNAPIDALAFARLWTSKEAVLKAEGIGLPGMKDMRIESLDGPHLTHTTYRNERRSVLHTRIQRSLVSLCLRDSPAPPSAVWHFKAPPA